MDINKQAELVPSVLNAIEGKPLSHQDRFVKISYSVNNYIIISIHF